MFAYRYVDELAALVESLWKEHQALAREGTICPHVFQRFDGKAIKSFRKAWLAACKAAGCPGRIPHDFRRTAVRNLVRAGIPETVAMQMTGHKTRSVFMRYDIVSEGDLDSAAQELNAAMTGTKTGTVGEKRHASTTPTSAASTSKRAS